MNEPDMPVDPDEEQDDRTDRHSRKLRLRMNEQAFEATHSHSEIVGFLRESCEIVKEVDPPADLRQSVFQIAQGMLATYHPLDTGVVVPGRAL